ncbi:hypothetical protein ACXET9_00860 [Brachybacterium sp. DNPG3]
MLGRPCRPRRSRPAGRRRRRLALPLAAVLVLALGGAAGGALGAPAAQADPGGDAGTTGAYAAEGEPVQGGTSIAQAPTIEPGIHLDSLPEGSDSIYADGSAAYYRVALAEGERVHAAATIAAPPEEDGLPEDREGMMLEVSVVGADGSSCTADSESGIGRTSTGDGPISATAVSEALGEPGCTGSALFVRVVRTGPRAEDEALPVEVQVAVEPVGVSGAGPSATEPVADEGADPVAPESADPIAPGRSFLSATALEEGSVVLELNPGDSALLAIDVAEGQRLRWRTEVTAAPEGSTAMSLRVFDAARSPVTVGGGDWSAYAEDIDGGGMSAPVAVGNRESEDAAIASAWLPGRHTVLVQRDQLTEDADDEDAAPLRLVLTLEVEGDPDPDAQEDVLVLGELSSADGAWGAGRIAAAVGAVLLGAVGILSIGAGAAMLVMRRRSRRTA